MSTFLGKYEVKADAKGRIFIPSGYRKLLPDGFRERVVMRHDTRSKCLIVYPEPVWVKKTEELKSRLDEWNPEDEEIIRQFTANAEWLDIDAQGRVLISKKKLESIGISNSEVLFVGEMDKFSIWSPGRYEQSQLQPEEFAERLQQKMTRKP